MIYFFEFRPFFNQLMYTDTLAKKRTHRRIKVEGESSTPIRVNH